MNEHEQGIAIAEACGWKRQEPDSCFFDDPTESFQVYVGDLPDYFHDLNAMHEAERTLNPSLAGCYARTLTSIAWQSEQPVFAPMSATAAQRAEAFLRTIGRWTETNSTKEPTHL
jgi:hypothetical protein